jgi:signal transduction histidine kinase
LATEAEQAREAAETANRLKSEFLANTSHELRTPLTNILASMEILDGTDLDPLQEKWLATARRAGGYLLHTVDDLLDMSQLEFGIVKIEQSTFSCSQVLDEAIDICRGVELFETISIVRDDRVNDQLTSDPMRLQQIIVNLLSNALKYGDGNPIELAILPPTLEDMQVRFEVRDDGIGIPADQHEAIFTRFQQLNGQTNRSHGGTGLGLSIVRELVKALGGTIGVISRPTGGTIFRVELPDLATRIADT